MVFYKDTNLIYRTMLNHLRPLAVFATVVECGSLRAAARQLQLSPSVVSHHLSQLEAQLGVALLYRSTRKLSLTRNGERLIGPARAMLQAAEDGIEAALDGVSELSGELRITAPALLANSSIADAIVEFSAAHPRVQLSLDFSEVKRDVIGEGIDIAIRAGWLQDSFLKSRKLFDEERVLVASTDYLASTAAPQSPHDLMDWNWLELAPVELRPVFEHPEFGKVSIRPASSVSANNALALYHLSKRGAGLAILPHFMTSDDIEAGTMQIVLPDWKLKPIGIYAVRPPNSPKVGLASAFIEALAS